MYDIHIEEFYRDCAVSLLTLYMSFPRKNGVFVEDIAGPDAPDEYGVHSARFQACFGAMLWLESEGYLNYESLIRQEALDQACLTSLGLRLLNDMDELNEQAYSDAFPKNVPNVEVIRYVLKNGTSTQLAQIMIQFFDTHRVR